MDQPETTCEGSVGDGRMSPFEQMTEQEQRYHVEEIHGVLYLRDEFVAVQHKEDHEQLDYPHTHNE